MWPTVRPMMTKLRAKVCGGPVMDSCLGRLYHKRASAYASLTHCNHISLRHCCTSNVCRLPHFRCFKPIGSVSEISGSSPAAPGLAMAAWMFGPIP